jgi:hypothetical protein
MEYAFEASPGVLDEVHTWSWSSEECRQLAIALCQAVSAAEELGSTRDGEVPSTAREADLDRIAMGRWEKAVYLAEELQRRVDGPMPSVVDEAMQRAEANGDIYAVTTAGDHQHGR